MDISQKESIISRIDSSFSEEGISNIISQFNIHNIKSMSRYSVEEFIALLKRMCKQLKNELSLDIWRQLPIGYSEPFEYGNVNIVDSISNLFSYSQNVASYYPNLEVELNKLIYYQVLNNFWDKSGVMYHSVDNLDTTELKDKASVLFQQLQLETTKLSESQLELEELKNKINIYGKVFEDKKDEANNFLDEIETKNRKISLLLTESEKTENKIIELGKTQEEKLKEVSNSIFENKKEYDVFKNEIILMINDSKVNQNGITKLLGESVENFEFIKSKEAEIIRYTGLAADSALGAKFDLRQKAILKGINFWKYAIAVITIIAISWAVCVFKYFSTTTDPLWFGVLINIIKTTPGFILLGFVIAQYSKERNLEEEYAFKSSVAMTITAYSDMLRNADDITNITRQQMLIKSIEQVYSKPKIHNEQRMFGFNNKAKELNETIKNLTDSVKSIKNIS